MKTLHLSIIAIISVLLIGSIDMSIEANSDNNSTIPKPVTDWLSTHPHFFGCVETNFTTGISKEISCLHPELPVQGVYEPPINSPLKQFKSGIAAKDVQCNTGLVLAIKSDDNSPRCLKPDTVLKLIYRGWAKEFVEPSVMKTNLQCGGIEVPSGNLRTGMIPVLMMQPNSTAIVCVTYQFISDWNSYPNKDVYQHGIFETCCLVHMGQYPDTQSSKFEILADPLLFNVTGVYNGSKTTVVYKIHAGPNSRGFYDSSIPYGNCNSYPLAVGYDSSHVNASDFSLIMDIPCFNTIDKVDSVKIVSGMSYKEVAFR